MTQKESAIAFLKAAASGNVREAYEKFVDHRFVHHNQYFKGDRQSLMVAMENAAKNHPNKFIEIKHIYEDKNTVITHSLVQRMLPEARPITVIHIFRFENGRIVELWDVGQEIMKDSPNENGAF